jgi:hypothetical protein
LHTFVYIITILQDRHYCSPLTEKESLHPQTKHLAVLQQVVFHAWLHSLTMFSML